MPSHGIYRLVKSYSILEMQIKIETGVCDVSQPKVQLALWKRFCLNIKYLLLLIPEHFRNVTYFIYP